MVVVGKQVGNFTSQIQLVKKELFTHTYTHIRIRKKNVKLVWQLQFGYFSVVCISFLQKPSKKRISMLKIYEKR